MAQSSRTGAQVKNPLAGQLAAAKAGKHSFGERCAACHGANAEGGRGPSLISNRDIKRMSDGRLFNTIRNGIPGTGMPPNPMPTKQTWEVVSFIRSLNAPAYKTPVEGDAEKGGAVFFGNAGCSTCHMIRGRGGFIGPDLTNVGVSNTVAQIRESILHPNKRIAKGFAAVTVVLKNGTQIHGVAKNNSNYSIQILDAQGRLHLLNKSDLKQATFARKSLMPDTYAKTLSRQDLQNLVAFLSGQTIRSKSKAVVQHKATIRQRSGEGEQIRYSEIRRSPSVNWLTYNGGYSGRRYSPLKKINRQNVGSLVPQWTYHVKGARRLETTPLVFDGVMYITNTNEVDAIDATTGRRIWVYQEEQTSRHGRNRGVALLGNAVFFVTGDCHLVALQRLTGAVLWEKQFADASKGYYATLAPLALKDSVIVGVSGGESGMRGFVAAFSASTGQTLWRFYTIPAKGEPGSKSWKKLDTPYGGGPTWMTGTFDSELNLIYWTTGNPWPDYYGTSRQGDDLYTDSVVALNADTGKLKWYFQFTPHDTHDWDAEEVPVLVDLEYQEKMRKLLLQANRNGFLYVLDRVTGQFLGAHAFVKKLNWAKGIDAKGRPIENPNMEPIPGGRKVCPSTRGATNWMSPAFDPDTKLLYVPTLEQCDSYVSVQQSPKPMHREPGGGAQSIPGEPGQFFLRAINPLTGARCWQYPMTGPATMWTGAVATAGGLVIFGNDDGQLVAVDAATGRDLWHYNTGQLLTASPITFSVHGKQFVSIAAGADIFTFGLLEPKQ
ncbi:MAG: PQQ-dependent dehydrogenase, methanol/ethanol family [Bryobacteraceae bacterium]